MSTFERIVFGFVVMFCMAACVEPNWKTEVESDCRNSGFTCVDGFVCKGEGDVWQCEPELELGQDCRSDAVECTDGYSCQDGGSGGWYCQLIENTNPLGPAYSCWDMVPEAASRVPDGFAQYQSSERPLHVCGGDDVYMQAELPEDLGLSRAEQNELLEFEWSVSAKCDEEVGWVNLDNVNAPLVNDRIEYGMGLAECLYRFELKAWRADGGTQFSPCANAVLEAYVQVNSCGG